MIGIVILGWASCLPEKIWAGEVHYSRIPVEYWEHRIQMIKALGMNALSVYVMWNYHEAKPGLFDFTTENRNLRGFLTLAQKHNMSVLLRPGPYVCAEWDFGGLPAWLLKEKQIEVRSLDLTFMSRSKLYIEKMAEQIRPFLAPNGPIVLLQIENEYGSWGNDHNYIASILNLWKAQIGDFEYYHADGDSGVPAGHVAGLSIGINGCASIGCFKNKTAMYPDAKLVFGGEIYPGWLTHWGESSFQHQDKAYTVQLFSFFVNNNVSFSMYMVHGGTNFGFTNGVNSPVNVHVTSYDYNAPINEHGLNTSKYNDLRAMFMKAAPWPVPDVPQPIPIKALPVIRPKLVSSYNSIGSFFPANFTKSGNAYTGPWSLEENDLPHGMVSYRFNATPGNNQMELYYADYMYVIISGVRTIYQTTKTSRYVNISFTCSTVCPVEITVQSLGHINYDRNMLNQRKGLFQIKPNFNIDAIFMKLAPLFPEDIFSAPPKAADVSVGYIFAANFTLKPEEIADSYLDMRNYTKGALYINGRNIGRHWNIGPQYRLYVPGVWLKTQNVLAVFDQSNKEADIISCDNLEGPGCVSQAQEE